MKKFIMLFAVASMAINMSAATYGILVNDKTFYEAAPLGDKDYQGRDQFLASVNLQQGDTWCVYDETNKAKFTIALEAGNGSAKANFTEGEQYATCNVAGCYDFYIKLKWEDNSMWVQNGSNCSAAGRDITDDPDPGPGPGPDPSDDDVNYYAMGWINGADAGETAYDTYDENLLFVDGKLTIDCKMGSYIGIKDHMCNYYYFRGEDDCHEDRVTLEWANGWSPCKKWAIPEGVNYIIVRSASYRGSIQLERVDKATYDAYHGDTQSIDNTKVMPKGGKIIVDGELRIVHGDKVFDATGRQL